MEQTIEPKNEEMQPGNSQPEKRKEDWENWVETKREVEIDENGELIIKRKTLEYKSKTLWWIRNKDLVDIGLRILGTLAIAIPIFLFYLQQQATKENQRSLLQIDIFSKLSITLNQLSQKHLSDSEYYALLDQMYFEIYPKIALISDTSISNKTKKTLYNIFLQKKFSTFLKESVLIIDPSIDYIRQQLSNYPLQYESIDIDYLDRQTGNFSDLVIPFINQVYSNRLFDFETDTSKIVSNLSQNFSDSIIRSITDLDSIFTHSLWNFEDIVENFKKERIFFRRNDLSINFSNKYDSLIEEYNQRNIDKVYPKLKNCDELQKKYKTFTDTLIRDLNITFIKSIYHSQ